MKKLKIYLDTSIINFIFADDAPEKQKLTVEFFEDYVSKNEFDIYISGVVIEEIEKTKDTVKRNKLLDVISNYDLTILRITDEIYNLAQKYLENKAVPQKKVEDARHIAMATFYECDILLSWNFRHLANINKERKITIVNLKEGYNYPIRLLTPLEVIGK